MTLRMIGMVGLYRFRFSKSVESTFGFMRKTKLRKKTVSKEEFDEFIESYPEPLGIGTIDMNPTLITYHDHSYGRYPENLAAFVVDAEKEEDREYHIYPFKVNE